MKPGSYSSLLAWRKGYLDQGYGQPATSPQRIASRAFAVQEGQKFQASIKMLRTATISGRIFDPNRAPLAMARVSPSILQMRPDGVGILGAVQPKK